MAEEQLISKKDLLARYGISYGALYRWKRKGLIPDEWFLKRSTVTGQETFFPEALVCERIERILSWKDEALLDELAQQFSGEEKKNEFLLLQTVFGEKNFRWCDLKTITLVDKTGKRIDITDRLREILEASTHETLGKKE